MDWKTGKSETTEYSDVPDVASLSQLLRTFGAYVRKKGPISKDRSL